MTSESKESREKRAEERKGLVVAAVGTFYIEALDSAEAIVEALREVGAELTLANLGHEGAAGDGWGWVLRSRDKILGAGPDPAYGDKACETKISAARAAVSVLREVFMAKIQKLGGFARVELKEGE